MPLLPDDAPIEAAMATILVTAFGVLVGLHAAQTHTAIERKKQSSLMPVQLPDPTTEPSRYCYELFSWYYSIFWIGIFGYIVMSQCYESFTAFSYLYVCGGLALPLVVQPLLYPQACPASMNGYAIVNPDTRRPFVKRYSTKAVLYLMTYSFIGNYWYTHYFYSVLNARYSMPAHRLNDVPIAMFLATHFYFTTYHAAISNGILRFVERRYADGWRKQVLFWYTVLFLSYFTAFMETLTISSFPYYSFEDRTMAYIWGSAFYGIYFVVSFPGFYHFDSCVDVVDENRLTGARVTLTDSFITACGHGMMILTMLDFVRLHLGIPLTIGGVAFEQT